MTKSNYEMSRDCIAALERMQRARAKRNPILNQQLDAYAASCAPAKPDSDQQSQSPAR